MAETSDVVFVAHDEGPPKRSFWICRDPEHGPRDAVRGWSFVYDEATGDGNWEPGWDTWEQWFFEILRYPPEYAAHSLVWRREGDGQVVDLQALQPLYDGKVVLPDETPDQVGLPSNRPRRPAASDAS